MITDKEKSECKIVELAVPGDHKINAKQLKKVIKYEIASTGVMEANVISAVIGAIGIVRNNPEKHLKTNGIPITISGLLNVALL